MRHPLSPKRRKEDFARLLLVEYPIDAGLIRALTTVEPCMSFERHQSQERKERGLKLVPRECLHICNYYLHPRCGFMNARIQTWFPFNVQSCLNGREWLGRQFAQRHVTDFLRHDNCFMRLGNPRLAQRLMDQQLALDWKRALDAIARSLNPARGAIFEPWPMEHHRSAYQSEWATDVLFKDPRALAGIYPSPVKHATHHFKSPDVMRFLGKKAHGNFTGELVTSFKDRAEGVRVKHRVNGNSIKMYDKAGSVLRVETTIAKTTGFKVFRPLQDATDGKCAWRPLREGIADLHRRAQVSQASNDRYRDALAAVSDDTPASRIFDAASRPATYRGRPCARSASATAMTSHFSKPSRTGSSQPPASATATCAASSTRPSASPPSRKHGNSPRARAADSACSAPTASSRRSPRPTATASPDAVNFSPQRSSPPAQQPSSSSSTRPHGLRAVRRFSAVVDQRHRAYRGKTWAWAVRPACLPG